MPSKNNSSKGDKGAKGMSVNWLSLITLLIVVSAIVTVLLMYLLGESFVGVDHGHLKTLRTEKIYEYPKDDHTTKIGDDVEGNGKGITVMDKLMFEKGFSMKGNLSVSSTTEFGSKTAPIKKLYVKDLQVLSDGPQVTTVTPQTSAGVSVTFANDKTHLIITSGDVNTTVTLPSAPKENTTYYITPSKPADGTGTAAAKKITVKPNSDGQKLYKQNGTAVAATGVALDWGSYSLLYANAQWFIL